MPFNCSQSLLICKFKPSKIIFYPGNTTYQSNLETPKKMFNKNANFTKKNAARFIPYQKS